MGKVRMGILDGWKGKLGTTVGFFWKGKAVNRAYTNEVRNPNTDSQKLVRAKFSLIGKQAKQMRGAIERGLRLLAEQKKSTVQAEFVKLNYGAITGSTPQALTLNYDLLQLAKGGLNNVQYGQLDFNDPNEVTAPITDAMLDEYCGFEDDNVFAAAYCPDNKQTIVASPAKREDESLTIVVPASWQGLKVYVYGWCETKDKTQVSDSVYLGFGNIS